jgi:hypothetical protein
LTSASRLGEIGWTLHAAAHAAVDAMRAYLARQSLPNVGVALDSRPPVTDPHSGKLREVIVAKRKAPAHR